MYVARQRALLTESERVEGAGIAEPRHRSAVRSTLGALSLCIRCYWGLAARDS